jgi:hypothetical protein
VGWADSLSARGRPFTKFFSMIVSGAMVAPDPTHDVI